MYEKGDCVEVKSGRGETWWNVEMRKYVGKVFPVLARFNNEYILEGCYENKDLNELGPYSKYWLFKESWLMPAQPCKINLKEQEIMEMFK